MHKLLGLVAWPCICTLAAVGCGDQTLIDADPSSVPQSVTFEHDIAPRIDYYCLACHSPDSQIGNAGGWDFTSYEQVRGGFSSIEEVAFEEQRMPPGGARRMTARDQAIFRHWRDLGFPRQRQPLIIETSP